MKFLIVLAVAVACAAGAAVGNDYEAPIVRSSYDISPEGNYQFGFETGNGIVAEASGVLKNVNSEYPSTEVKGSYKYVSPEGEVVETVYTADENGFTAQGSHLPVAPPVPEAILRSLEYIAAHPPKVEKVSKLN